MKATVSNITLILISIFILISCAEMSGTANDILVEAESMESYGGWVLDQQSMVAMGSPYLLAHGMGGTGCMMDEVVGMAAAICKSNDALPRDVYTTYLDELKASMKKGVGKRGIY